tara:strand:- start:2122 stop:2259 length:138 start_codon:yes stop_codon:yes gene_type:complete
LDNKKEKITTTKPKKNMGRVQLNDPSTGSGTMLMAHSEFWVIIEQ